MSEVLIFGGTTEGRLLAEFCFSHGIPAATSVATETGRSLLGNCRVLVGRLNAAEMTALLTGDPWRMVIDATHPYAAEATRNIRLACTAAHIPCYRLVREQETVSGTCVSSMEELLPLLQKIPGNILSTLGSSSVPALADFRERLWVRILPSAKPDVLPFLPETHILTGQGRFSVADNIAHIRQTNAAVLLTKESGTAGGYAEKVQAAESCGIQLITLVRKPETGFTLEEIEKLLTEGSP